jgi:hypothetical protein
MAENERVQPGILQLDCNNERLARFVAGALHGEHERHQRGEEQQRRLRLAIAAPAAAATKQFLARVRALCEEKAELSGVFLKLRPDCTDETNQIILDSAEGTGETNANRFGHAYLPKLNHLADAIRIGVYASMHQLVDRVVYTTGRKERVPNVCHEIL